MYKQVFIQISTTPEKRENYKKYCRKKKIPVGTRIKNLVRENDNINL